MKFKLLAMLLIGILPAVALADHRGGDRWDRGGNSGYRNYDRGDRYRGSGHSARSSFDFSIGFGSHNSFSRFSYRDYDYGYRPVRYYSPTYYPPPVVYQEPVYVAPPVIVYPSPAPTYYYSSPSATYYSSSRYYYCR